MTGETLPRSALLRFAVSPEGTVVFDLEAKLPGRGIWIVPKRSAVELAVVKKLFPRAAKGKAVAPVGLGDQVASQLRRNALELLSLCRKSGLLVAGFEKVREAVENEKVQVLLHAADAADDGQAKLERKYDGETVTCFTRQELGQVTARDNAVHLAVSPSPLADQFVRAARRLTGFEE